MIAVDFFCGAGGLTRGLLDAGIDVVAGIDADVRCKETYEYNNTPAKFLSADIQSLRFEDVRALMPTSDGSPFLFAGCAPCQSFSSQRKSKSPRADSTILVSFGRIIEEFRPQFVLIENVPGLTRVKGFSAYRRFLRVLKTCGYQFSDGVVDAKDYGVPQTRRRYVLLGALGEKPEFPIPLCGKDIGPYGTVRETISHFPSLSAGEEHSRIPNHVAAAISEINITRLKYTPANGGDRRAWPKKLILACHRGDYNGHTDVYGRMKWDSPAPTLTGRCHSISNGRYGHPEQDRAISLREAASLQTFSDDYVFFGNLGHVAQQIGNAVPVRLAEVLGRQLVELSTG